VIILKKKYDLGFLKDGLKEDITSVITDAFSEATDEGFDRGEKILKERSRKAKERVKKSAKEQAKEISSEINKETNKQKIEVMAETELMIEKSSNEESKKKTKKIVDEQIDEVQDEVNKDTKKHKVKAKVEVGPAIEEAVNTKAKKNIEISVKKQLENAEKIVEQAKSKYVKKWGNFDLIGELDNTGLDISSIEKKLKKIFDSDNLYSTNGIKRFLSLYAAHQELGGNKNKDYEDLVKAELTNTGYDKDVGIKNRIEFYNTLYDTAKRLVPILKEAKSEIETTQEIVDKSNKPKKVEKGKPSSDKSSETVEDVVKIEKKKQKAIKETRKQIDYEKASVEELIATYKKSEKALKTSKKQETIDFHNNVIASAGSSLESRGYSLVDGSWNQTEVLSGTDDVQPVIEGQEKIQNKLKETENQARVTADAIKEAYERRESSHDSWDKASINRTLNSDEATSMSSTRQVLTDLKNAHEAYDLSINNQWDWEHQYQWAVKFIAFYEEYASRANGTAKSLAKHTELYNQLKPLAEGYRADLQAVLDYKPKVNQTPLSSDSKADEITKETAIEVKQANEKIIASNKEAIASEEAKEKALSIDNSIPNTSSIDAEKAKLKELEKAVSLVIEEIDRKTQAFHNEKAAVDLIIPTEIAKLEALEGELITIRELLEQISKVTINLSFDTTNLDENTQKVLKDITESLNNIDTSSLGNIGNILEGFKISKSNVDNLQKLANAILTLKSNLNNIGGQGQQFLSDIKELISHSDNLKNLATIITATSQKIKQTKEAVGVTQGNIEEKDTNKLSDDANNQAIKSYEKLINKLKTYYDLKLREDKLYPKEQLLLKELEKNINDAIEAKDKFANSPFATEKAKNDLAEMQNTFKKVLPGGLKTYLNEFAEKYELKVNRSQINPKDLKYVNEYNKKLSELHTKIGSIKESNVEFLSDDNFKVLGNTINEIISDFEKLKESIGRVDVVIADETKAYSTLEHIEDQMRKNDRMAYSLRIKYEQLRDSLRQAFDTDGKIQITDKELDNLIKRVARLDAELKSSGKTGKTLFSQAAQRLGDMNSKFIAQYFSFQDILRYGRQAIETIREYDKALTEMNKVSDESIRILKEFQTESFELANEIGTTAQQIQNSTADWMRLGESLEEAKQSAQDANILFNVSEFESIDEATSSLVSMSQAFKDLEKGEIIDVVNNLGNNFAISTDGLATALQNSASSLKTAKNDFYEAAALATAANTVVQDPSKVGTGLRTIALRLTGTEAAREELAALGEDVDDFVVTTTSKLDQQIKDLTKTQGNFGVSLLDMNGNYRSTYEVLLDIAKVWDKIAEEDLVTGENRQNALLEMMSGKNRSNILASVLQSPDVLEEAYAYALDSEGSALKENEAYLESIEGHMAQLKNSWDNLFVSENNRETITFFLDLAKSILDAANNFGAFNSIAMTAAGLFGAVKGEGRVKKFTLIKYAFEEFNGDVYELCIA